jgi:hypothetical protein
MVHMIYDFATMTFLTFLFIFGSLNITFRLHLLSVKGTAMLPFVTFELPAMHLSPTILSKYFLHLLSPLFT